MFSFFSIPSFQVETTNRMGTLILGWVGVVGAIHLAIVSAILAFSPLYRSNNDWSSLISKYGSIL